MMKIAFAADNKKGLDSSLSSHFGRCPYYIFVEVDEGGEVSSIEEKDNPFYNLHQPGQVPQFIKESGAGVIISGGMGRRAAEFFQKLNIKPITASLDSIRNILSRYLAGELEGWQECFDSRHHHHFS